MGSTGSLSLFRLCCWLLLMAASVIVKAEEGGDLCMLDKDDTNVVLSEAKCVPLRILTEQYIVTQVGEFCVDFTDATQTTMEVVYSTQGTNYTLVDLHLYAGPDVKHVPSNGVGMPKPQNFEYQLLFDEDEDEAEDDLQMKSLSFPTSRLGAMNCPSETDYWTKYLVAHATVRLDNQGEKVDVYAHEGYLFKYNNVELAETEFFSYVQLDLSCNCQDDGDGDHSNIFAPNSNGTDTDGNETRGEASSEFNNSTNNNDTATVEETTSPSTNTLAPSSSSFGSTESPTSSPTLDGTSAMTMSPTEEKPRMTPPPVADNPPPPPLRPAQNLAGEDLVVGMSFIVLTDTSAEAKTEFDRQQVQRGFADFTRNVLEDMQVFPLPRLASAAGMRNDNNDNNDNHNGGRRRQLWVKYDNSSIHVYTFLVSTYCSPDDGTSVIQQSSSSLYAAPPVQSQCHRAYARFGVRIVGEDPIRVCETLRNGTLLGYQQGMLQQAMLTAYPDTTIQLQPGDFEYCVPVADFVVPNHTAPYDIISTNETTTDTDTSWTDSDPLANLTKTTVVEEPPTEIPWILLLIIGLLLLLSACSGLTVCYLQRRREKEQEQEEEDKLNNEAPPEVTALMA